MIKKILTGAILLGGISLILALGFSLFRATSKILCRPNARFFMPNDLFIYLILLINYWVMLLILLESSSMPDEYRVTIMITTSLFAPFLNWWYKKRKGEI